MGKLETIMQDFEKFIKNTVQYYGNYYHGENGGLLDRKIAKQVQEEAQTILETYKVEIGEDLLLKELQRTIFRTMDKKILKYL